MSDVTEILEQVREHYLSGYHQSISDFSDKHNKSSPEVLLQLQNKEELPQPYQLYRIDMASGDVSPPKLVEFNHPNHLSFNAIEFTAGDINAVLHPIMWNGVEFKTDIFTLTDDKLTEWALKWIDVDETGVSDEFGLAGYIHSITYPEIVDGKMHFSVDFGSSSVDSFYELFGVFIELGVKNVEVYSSNLVNEN